MCFGSRKGKKMKKRLRKKMIASTYDMLPVKLYEDLLFKKRMLPYLICFYRAFRKPKGYKMYATITSFNETVAYKTFKH